MRNTSGVGNVTEAIVLAALVKAGRAVLLPFGDAHPYDLLVDEGDRFVRVQCKTGRLMKKGVISFSTSSWQRSKNAKGANRSYIGRADAIAVYCPPLDKVYLVPVENCPKTNGYLRLSPSNNKQSAGIRWAKDYELDPNPPSA
jgi:hypothetical protein